MRAKGIDISKYQLSFTPQNNIDFIIQKVSEGLAKDALYDELLPSVKTIERRGGYHYFRTEVDPIAQAEFFYKAQAGQGFKWLAVDYEKTNNVLDEQGAINLGKFWIHLETLTDKFLLLYTSPYTYRDNLCAYNAYWGGVDLWMAHYNGGNPQTEEPELFGGHWWAFWQYTNEGSGSEYGVGSTYVDLNVFNGTVQELDAWLGIEEVIENEIDLLTAKTTMNYEATVANATEIESLAKMVSLTEDWHEGTVVSLLKFNDEVVNLNKQLGKTYAVASENVLDIARIDRETATIVEEYPSLAITVGNHTRRIDKLNERLDELDIDLTASNQALMYKINELEAKQKEDTLERNRADVSLLAYSTENTAKIAGITIPETNHSHFWMKWEWFKKLTGYYNQRG